MLKCDVTLELEEGETKVCEGKEGACMVEPLPRMVGSRGLVHCMFATKRVTPSLPARTVRGWSQQSELDQPSD